MDLKMEIYTPSLELIGLLEIQRSVIANTAAFSAGSFSIYSLITDETRDLLQPENIVAISDDVAGIIEHVEEESDERGPYITIKGRLLSGILDRRILWGLYDLTGTPAAIMRYLVNDCAINPTRGKDADDIERRKIPGLVLADGFVNSGETIRKQITGGSLLEALEELGETYQVAFGVRINPKTQLMEFWTRNGVNRTIHQTKNEPVFFSTELDDVLSSAYTYDSKNYKNLALVAGEGEGANRTSTVVEKFEDIPVPPVVEMCTITLTVDPAGGGSVTGGGEVRVGRKTTVKAAPTSGYEFVGWKQNGSTVSTSESYTFTATEDTTLTAVFAVIVPTYHIQTAIDPAGSGTASGAGYYKQGVSVTLTALPWTGYKFVAWRENGSNISTSTAYTFTASANRTITAVFAAVYTVTTAIDPAGSGTSTGAGSYDAGATVTLTATPSTGYKFVAWNENGSQISADANYTFTINGNRLLTAMFEVVPQYTVTTAIEPTGYGTATGAGTYTDGTSVTLVATAASGYQFVAWQINGTNVSTDASYTFVVSADVTVTAVFKVYSRVPDGYTEIEYVTFNKNSSFNTGVICDFSKTRIVTTIMLSTYANTAEYIFNSNDASGKKFALFRQSATALRYMFYNMTTAKNTSTVNSNQKLNIEINFSSRKLYVGSGSYTIPGGSAVGTKTIYIGKNSEGYSPSMKIYELKVYSGSTLQKHWIPTKNNSTGSEALYDLVNKKFW